MEFYWALLNFLFLFIWVSMCLGALVSFCRDLLSKKNYVLQLPQTSSQNLQEIQLQCEDILDHSNQDRRSRTRSNGRSKFQLMELSKEASLAIKAYVQNITYVSNQRITYFTNYHYFPNFMKDEQEYPKLILQKSAMYYLLSANIVMQTQLHVIYKDLVSSKRGENSMDYWLCLYVALVCLPPSLLLNKYLVYLESTYGYYALFNNLKFQKVQAEQQHQEIQKNLIYDKGAFKEYTKPVKLVVQRQQGQYMEEQQEKEKEKPEVDILFMKVDSQNSIESEEDQEEQDMIDKLEQQDDYKGLYYLGLATFSVLLYLSFINFNALFHANLSTNYVLLLKVGLSTLMDCVLRYLFVFVVYLFNLCMTQRQGINFAQVITRLQIFEVFEEHIKFGMYCMQDDVPFSEDNVDDYSMLSLGINEANVKSMLPRSAPKHKQEEHWFFKEVRQQHHQAKQEQEEGVAVFPQLAKRDKETAKPKNAFSQSLDEKKALITSEEFGKDSKGSVSKKESVNNVQQKEASKEKENVAASPEKEGKGRQEPQGELRDFKFVESAGFNSQQRPDQLLQIGKRDKEEDGENYSPIKGRPRYSGPELEKPFN